MIKRAILIPVLLLLVASPKTSTISLARLEEKRIVVPHEGIEYPPAHKFKIPGFKPPININIIGSHDVVGQSSFEGKQVEYCTPGKEVPQNEIAAEVNPRNPLNIVVGANDYRLINDTSMRYDGSGSFYRTVNGGKTWIVGFLPGMVLGNQNGPIKFTSTSDPTVAASTKNVFWYCNLLFHRDGSSTAIGISRSTNGGLNWKTSVIHEISNPPVESELLNDKPWLAADPINPNVAFVTWTLYRQTRPERPIVYTKTTDGGRTFKPPIPLTGININQGSEVVVDTNGNAHVVWFASPPSGDFVAYRKIQNNGKLGPMRLLSRVRHVASPVPWAAFYTNSFPSIAIDGETLHVVWTNWNAKNADIVYIRSTNSGVTWSKPRTIAGGPNYQFLPSVAANAGRVAVGFSDHVEGNGATYHASTVISPDGGTTWSEVLRISTAPSEPNEANRFDFPNCTASFIGDYNDTTVDRNGVAHFFWTDIRIGNSKNDPGSTADQDAYMASLAFTQ